MTGTLKRRVKKLEIRTYGSDEVSRALRLAEASFSVHFTPELATAEEKVLVAKASSAALQLAWGIALKAVGGLAALVRRSYELEAEEKRLTSQDLNGPA